MFRTCLSACVVMLTSFAASGVATAQSPAAPPLTLYMPDGQLASHSIRIYVNRPIAPDAGPKLRLFGDNAAIKPPSGSQDGLWVPRLVAPGQSWSQPGPDGTTQIAQQGTLLLFDLNAIDFDWRAMRRLMPVVTWTDGGKPAFAVGQSEVNLGNTLFAGLWTGGIVIGALVAVLVLCAIGKVPGGPIRLLLGADGHLSLAQSQVAAWTIVVGSIVLAYGLVRLKIPEIPASLLALMGASLATGGIGFFKDAQKQQAAAGAGAAIPQKTWSLGDLLKVSSDGTGQKTGDLSLAKAQMFFWTVLLIVLFVVKSALEGAIWNVPWELVALMGFSQAGYLAPKVAS